MIIKLVIVIVTNRNIRIVLQHLSSIMLCPNVSYMALAMSALASNVNVY